MPVQKKKKVTSRRRAATATGADPLPRKLHDLANSLEAVSLARLLVPRDARSARILETLDAAIDEARKALHQMDAELREAGTARRQAVGR